MRRLNRLMDDRINAPWASSQYPLIDLKPKTLGEKKRLLSGDRESYIR
jgi:hypothetical protein